MQTVREIKGIPFPHIKTVENNRHPNAMSYGHLKGIVEDIEENVTSVLSGFPTKFQNWLWTYDL